MEDGVVSQEPEAAVAEVPEVAPQTEAPPAESNSTEGTSSGGNPVWAPVREAVGEFAFHKIQPTLAEWDRQAQARITELNSRFEPWKPYQERGVTPEQVDQAFEILQRMESNPVELYQALEAHLRDTGRLPQGVQEQQPQTPDPFEDEDPRDAALRELQEQNQQITQFLMAQAEKEQRAQAEAQADQALNQEIESLRAARPTITKQEEAEIIQRALLYAQAGQQKTLADVAAEFDDFRSRILSTPRPTDLAPRIPGAGGTAPTGNHEQKAPSEYSREESQALMADLLSKGKQGS